MKTSPLSAGLLRRVAFGSPLSAMATLFVAVCVLAALTGGGWIPDRSPNANLQAPALARSAPGTKAFLLLSGERLVKVATSAAEAQAIKTDLLRRNPQQKIDIQPRTFYLGTDALGRDLLSRLVLGTRLSLFTGLASMLVSVLIGLLVGMTAGYIGGFTDGVLQWFSAVFWALPSMLLALLLAFVFGQGLWQVVLAIGLAGWVDVARLVRGQVLVLRTQGYTEAARVSGAGHLRIMFRHLLPNLMGPLLIVAVANFGAAILLEAGLSFLGVGVEPQIPSWGRMIADGYAQVVFAQGKWMAVFPGVALMLLIISVNLLGASLRDALATEEK